MTGEDLAFVELRELHDVLLKLARRCAQDLQHVLDNVSNKAVTELFVPRQQLYATAFDDLPAYRSKLHAGIGALADKVLEMTAENKRLAGANAELEMTNAKLRATQYILEAQEVRERTGNADSASAMVADTYDLPIAVLELFEAAHRAAVAHYLQKILNVDLDALPTDIQEELMDHAARIEAETGAAMGRAVCRAAAAVAREHDGEACLGLPPGALVEWT